MALFKKISAVRLQSVIRLFLLLLLLPPLTALPAPSALAAAYTVRKWTLDDGLPDSQVCGVVPGQDGYLWLATARHLVRFDGLRFMTVTLPPQSDVGRNEGIFQDSRGGLWIFGFLGAVRYKDGAWWQSEAAGMPRGRVTSVTESPDGVVYLAQERVIYAWQDGVARPVLEASAFPNESGSFRQLVWSRDGGLWIALGDGLYCWSPERAEPPASMTDIRAEWVLLSADGHPLVAHGSFICLRRKGGLWERLPDTRPVSARYLLETGDGALWVGHDDGVDLFCDGTWHAQLQTPSFGSMRVQGMAADREGSLWLATTDGLVRLRHRIMQGVPWRDRTDGPPVSVIWVESGDRVWAGLRTGGLAIGDADGVSPLPVPPELADAVLTALYRETNSTLWCGGFGGRVWSLREENLQRVESVWTDQVRAMVGSGKEPSWLATGRGVFAYQAQKHVLSEMDWPLDPVLSLWLDGDGYLWAGHESLGMAALRSGGRAEFYSKNDLPGNTIRAIYRDKEGVLWIGGLAGLARWEGERRFVFRRAQGLWSESVRQISEDSSGCLWLGTAAGVMRIAKKELAAVAAGQKDLLEVRTFGVEAGMEQEECTGGVFFPLGEPPLDRLWFPTRAGLLTLNTRNLPLPRLAPALRVTGVGLGALASLGSAAYPAGSTRSAEAEPRDVSIEYAALDFCTPERVRFRYELTGPVVQRSGLTEDRRVVFSRLPPGAYSFRVTACNGDGVWNPDGATVAWTVRPYFWETAAFRLWCLVLGCGGVALAVRTVERRRVHRKLEASERQEGLARERARIARDLHDEIGAKLTRLSLLGAMAAEDAKGAEPLRREIEEMADSARETHRAFDEIVWSVSPRNDTVRSLSHYICKYAEEFFAGTPVRCHFQLPEDMTVQPVEPQRRHQMFLAVKEGLHNVLKHAAATRVDITVRLPEGCLRVELADNGCGFEPALAGTQGDGLRNMQERMKVVGGTLSLASAAGAGTRLVFEMPV